MRIINSLKSFLFMKNLKEKPTRFCYETVLETARHFIKQYCDNDLPISQSHNVDVNNVLNILMEKSFVIICSNPHTPKTKEKKNFLTAAEKEELFILMKRYITYRNFTYLDIMGNYDGYDAEPSFLILKPNNLSEGDFFQEIYELETHFCQQSFVGGVGSCVHFISNDQTHNTKEAIGLLYVEMPKDECVGNLTVEKVQTLFGNKEKIFDYLRKGQILSTEDPVLNYFKRNNSTIECENKTLYISYIFEH